MAVVTPAGAHRRGQRDRGAAQPGLVGEPGAGRALLATPFAGLPLVICGVLKIAYDLSLLVMFRHTKPPEEQRGIRSTAAG